MELSKKLQASGWHLTDEGIKTLTSAVGDGDPDPGKLIDEALNRDLRDIGGGALPTKRDDSSGTIAGRIVLQVQRVRNISAPKSNEESKAAPRLLQLELSDGQASLLALELEPVPALNLNVAPGTKIFFRAEKLQLVQGYLLLRPNDFQILGGRVEALYEKWDFTRTMLKYARSGRPITGSSAPPPWVAFGKSIDANADGDFKSLAKSTDKDKPAKENDEFNSMRTEAISVASKAGVKKVFGGGGQHIIDHNIKKILEKGYSKEEAKIALQVTRNNLERALFNLKRRRDAADGVSESHVRGGRVERPAREAKRGASLKDEAEATKPAANTTLFDFLTTKLRTPVPTTSEEAPSESLKTSTAVKPIAKPYENAFKASAGHQLADNKTQSFGERSRFENNVSTSFAANRGGHSGRFQRGGPRSRAGRDDRSSRGGSSSYNDRGGGVAGGSMRKQDVNSRSSEHTNAKNTSRNGHDYSVSTKGAYEGKQESSAKEQGSNRRINERQSNRNGNARAENGTASSSSNNRRRQQASGTCGGAAAVSVGKATNAYNSNNDEFNNRLNKVVADTANIKLSSIKREHKRGGRQGGQTSRHYSEPQGTFHQLQKASEKTPPAQRQQKLQLEKNSRQQSNASCTQLPNGYTYDPSKIMGFQTKETNEFAMSLLKSQGLAVAPPSLNVPPQSPPKVKETSNLSSAQTNPTSNMPSILEPAAIPTPPDATAEDLCDVWVWKGGDLCLAKYWDDGRYYEAEITAVSENTCVVFFLGYGNHEEVLKSDILPITDAQNRPLTNVSQPQHPQTRYRGDRQAQQQQVYVPPHKRDN